MRRQEGASNVSPFWRLIASGRIRLMRKSVSWKGQPDPERTEMDRRIVDPAAQDIEQTSVEASPSKAETLMLHDYQQAWDHTRHLETMRSQYLGFLFTIALGSIALGVPVVGSGALNNPVQLVALSSFLAVLFLITVLIYISVRRFGIVYAQYQDAIYLIRDHFYAGDQNLDAILVTLHFHAPDHPVVRSRLPRVHTAVEIIVQLFFFLTLLATISIALRLWALRALVWQIGLSAGLGALMLFATFLLVLARRGTR